VVDQAQWIELKGFRLQSVSSSYICPLLTNI
jgi:hypothetical protein